MIRTGNDLNSNLALQGFSQALNQRPGFLLLLMNFLTLAVDDLRYRPMGELLVIISQEA